MKPQDLYESGKYRQQNPSLHREDSAYKMRYVSSLLAEVEWPRRPIRVLDVGGGAGDLGRMVCEWFAARGHGVECSALDLSEELLAVQRAGNPHVVETVRGDLSLLAGRRFDLALLVDVIEHVPDCEAFAAGANRIADYALYNIPIERNLCDWLRNAWMRGRYYPLQRASLGHLHFFTPRGARMLVSRHHRLISVRVPEFARHLLETEHAAYALQRERRLRNLELRLSASVRRILPGLAPWIVQGSLFMLAKAR